MYVNRSIELERYSFKDIKHLNRNFNPWEWRPQDTNQISQTFSNVSCTCSVPSRLSSFMNASWRFPSWPELWLCTLNRNLIIILHLTKVQQDMYTMAAKVWTTPVNLAGQNESYSKPRDMSVQYREQCYRYSGSTSPFIKDISVKANPLERSMVMQLSKSQ